MEEKQLYIEAINKLGGMIQLDIMVEECAELIQALNKFKRARTDEQRSICCDNICEEIADVEIMIGQIKVLFNNNEKQINKWKAEKLGQLRGLLDATPTC